MDKDTLSSDVQVILQKYYLEGRLIWAGNAGFEATYADRGELSGLPAGYDWPTDPEMEIELGLGTAVSYRFAPNWFVGVEAKFETEFETEVGQERWSYFGGPTLHYGGEKWWATLTWMPQLLGGGETYPGQSEDDLHLVEKTKQEVRLRVGFNF